MKKFSMRTKRETNDQIKLRSLLLFCLALLYTTSAQAVPGRDGSDGQKGQDGRSGPSKTHHADGSYAYLDLSGRDGQTGGDGEHGTPAWACGQEFRYKRPIISSWDKRRAVRYGRIYKRFRLSRGGDGGDAGRGGDGGSSGDLRVYYDRLADLSKIEVDQSVGLGAYSGDFGEGAEGCHCPFRRKVRRVCVRVHRDDRNHQDQRNRTDRGDRRRRGDRNDGDNRRGRETRSDRKKDESPHTLASLEKSDIECGRVIFVCEDGFRGRRGHSARAGHDGSMGSIELIQHAKNYTEERRRSYRSLGSPDLEQAFVLRKNIWRDELGAQTLFHPGSIIRDRYRLFEGQISERVQIQWSAKQKKSKFRAFGVSLFLDENGRIKFEEDKGVFLETETRRNDSTTTWIIHDAHRIQDLRKISFDYIQSRGSKTYGKIRTQYPMPKTLELKVKAKVIRKKWLGKDPTVAEGFIDVLTINDTNFVIKIGDPDSYREKQTRDFKKAFESGSKINVELDVFVVHKKTGKELFKVGLDREEKIR